MLARISDYLQSMVLFKYYLTISLKSQTEFCGQRPPQLVVAKGHNIIEVTGTPICGRRPPWLLVAEGHNIIEVTGPPIRGRRPT